VENSVQIERTHAEMQMQILALLPCRLRNRGGFFGSCGFGDLSRFGGSRGGFFGCGGLAFTFLKLEADFILF
jgi:hypothetical protein